MSRRVLVLIVAIAAGAAVFSPALRAQDAKWNKIPPGRATYRDKKPAGVAPKRDLTGIWDAMVQIGGSGNVEHPATYPGGRGIEGGHEDETGIVKPLPYT